MDDLPHTPCVGLCRGDQKHIASKLAHSELFQDAPESLLYFVIDQSEILEVGAGHILLSPEEQNEHVYVLLSGQFSLHFESPESAPIRLLEPGVSVGELSLIDESPPSAYVLASVDSRVLALHRSVLYALLADTNVVSRNMLRMLTRWIKANTRRIVEDRRTIRELSASRESAQNSV